jgi:hypothetical protein
MTPELAQIFGLFRPCSKTDARCKAISEVHLITSAPLVVASTSATAASVDYVQHNAIFDAAHMASVPQDAELRLGGLTSPST